MRIFITGEKGFIGTNLIARSKLHDIDVVTFNNSNYENYFTRWTDSTTW